MKSIDCSTLYLPLLCRHIDYLPSLFAQCITCVDGATPIAGAVYDGFNGVTISAHIWIKNGCVPCRDWYGAIFDYPFNRLGISKLVGQVASTNSDAIKLDEHFGFIEEARIKDYSEAGDMIIYTMTRAQCRVLNSPLWSRVTTNVARAA